MPTALHEQLYVGDFLFEWEVAEYDAYERPKQWYVIVGLLSLGLIVFGILSNNFLFTLIILLAGIIVYVQASQPAISVPVAVTSRGIIIGRRFYAYDECTEFYIIFIPEQTKTLYIETKSLVQPRLQIDIHDIDAVTLRQTLSLYLQENFEKEEEPVSEQLRKIWRIH